MRKRPTQCNLMDHSFRASSCPTQWITQDADAIDTDMHARPDDAEFWIVHHSTLRRNFAASCGTPSHTSNFAASSRTSQRAHSRWTGRTCAPSRSRSAKVTKCSTKSRFSRSCITMWSTLARPRHTCHRNPCHRWSSCLMSSTTRSRTPLVSSASCTWVGLNKVSLSGRD